MNRQKRTRWVLFFLSAVCLLSLGLPLLYGAGSNAWLQREGNRRPVPADALSARGQAVPLVYALYRSRFAASTTQETATDAGPVQQALREETAALAQAGALPELVAARADWILSQQPAAVTSKRANGFSSVTWRVDAPEAQTYWIAVVWHEKTGYVVSYTVTVGDIPTDLEPHLTAYQAFLGLDVLTDWEELPLEVGAAAWSQDGQIVAACNWKDKQFTLEVKSQPEKPWNPPAV